MTIVAAVFLTACGSATEERAANEMEVEDIKQLVHEYSIRDRTAENASITSHQLLVTEDDGSENVYDLAEEDFFVSIAPYVNQTHPCQIHSLTSCQGEMVEEEFAVYIEDTKGNVIVDETMKTLENGFIDLWLPRDETYQVKIEHEGLVTEAELSTFENDDTCVTTMQLM